MLSKQQKLSFKQNGFLVVEDAIDEDVVTACREAAYEALDLERDDLGLLEAEDDINAWEDELEDAPFDELNEQAHAYAEELVGDALAEPRGRTQLAVRYPDGEVHSGSADQPSEKGGGHVDGYGPNFSDDGDVRSFTIAASTYLDDVLPRGGGFTVWPGSHIEAAKFFTTHSLETLGHAHGSNIPTDLGDPFECAGDAGTTILWHNKLAHSGGIHRSPNVRMAAISRFAREDLEEIRRDAADKPFKYWDGLDGVYPELNRNPATDEA